jgi:PLD-like domain
VPTIEFHADSPFEPKALGPAIRSTFRNTKTLRLAVAYVCEDVFDLLALYKGCDITLVCDLRSPACNPFVIKTLIQEKGVKVRAFNGLHAKVYLSDEAVCVGSANLSAHALKAGSLEAGSILRDAASIRKASGWFARLAASSADAEPIIRNKRAFEDLVANWSARDRRTNGNTRPSLLTAILEGSPLLEDYLFGFYINSWKYTDPQARRAALKKGMEIPPSKVWHRYEDDYSPELKKYIQREMGMNGKKSIGFEVKALNDVITTIRELDSEGSIFVNQFRLGNQLLTNLLEETRSPFRLTGKDAGLLCSRLTAGLKKDPQFAKQLSKRLGWFATAKDLQRLLE